MDELKILLLDFFFDLNNSDGPQIIDRILINKIAAAVKSAGLTRYDLGELFLDTISGDAISQFALNGQECLYILELCMAGRNEDAEHIVQCTRAS